MYSIVIYSRELCVQCGGVMRAINKNINSGLIAPSDVLVVMTDGSPRNDKKVHPDVEVQSPDGEERDRIRAHLVDDLKCMQAPVVVLQGGDGSEVEHFSGLCPGKIKEFVQAVASQDLGVLATA